MKDHYLHRLDLSPRDGVNFFVRLYLQILSIFPLNFESVCTFGKGNGHDYSKRTRLPLGEGGVLCKTPPIC